MTMSEFMAESMVRGNGETYAGGMTEGDIEEIKRESAKLRRMREAKRGTTTSQS